MQVDQIDLIQMHNLTNENDWQTAMGPGGALEALVEAKEQGLVRLLALPAMAPTHQPCICA